MNTKTAPVNTSLDIERADMLTLLTFTVANQVYGLPVVNVVRIIEMVAITHLPGVSEFIRGIINLQGKVVSVMDLRYRFNLSPQAYGLHTPIVLTEAQDNAQMLGLIVDSVEDVVYVSSQNLDITEKFVSTNFININQNYLTGVARVERQIIPVLNINALLTPAEQQQLLHALAEN